MIQVYGVELDLGYFLAFLLLLWTCLSSSFAVFISRRFWPRDEPTKLDPGHELYPVGLPEMSDEMKAELRQSLAELVEKRESENVMP